MCYNLQARGVNVIKYKKNEIVKGCVTGIEKYGAFISLDEYYSGLIHISEISNGFVSDIHNFLEIGETIYIRESNLTFKPCIDVYRTEDLSSFVVTTWDMEMLNECIKFE